MPETDDHRPEPWFWEAGGDDCPHGPEPEDDTTEAWDDWSDRHTWSPQDVRVCLDAPAGDMCAACSEDHGEGVPWSACRSRTRANRKDIAMPEQPNTHQPITVQGGSLECLERECEDFFDDEGDEIPGKETCSHLAEIEICAGCSPEVGADFVPVVAWTDCPQRVATPAP